VIRFLDSNPRVFSYMTDTPGTVTVKFDPTVPLPIPVALFGRHLGMPYGLVCEPLIPA
jgi:hypothetical protein